MTFMTTPGMTPAPLAVYWSTSSSSFVMVRYFYAVYGILGRGWCEEEIKNVFSTDTYRVCRYTFSAPSSYSGIRRRNLRTLVEQHVRNHPPIPATPHKHMTTCISQTDRFPITGLKEAPCKPHNVFTYGPLAFHTCIGASAHHSVLRSFPSENVHSFPVSEGQHFRASNRSPSTTLSFQFSKAHGRHTFLILTTASEQF